jgi:hypothetical protein
MWSSQASRRPLPCATSERARGRVTNPVYWRSAVGAGLLLVLAGAAAASPDGAPRVAATRQVGDGLLGQAAAPEVVLASDPSMGRGRAARLRRRSIDPRSNPAMREAVLERGRDRGRLVTRIKLGLALAVIALLIVGSRLASRGRGGDWLRTRHGLLLGLAVLAFASSYNFFQWRHYDGIHAHEVFHYYLGSKYFEELGYFDLYECAIVASTEGRPALAGRTYEVRDLRNIDQRKRVVPAQLGPRCREAFEPERWRAFGQDVRWLRDHLPEREWNRILIDQGFNASPVWTLFGRPLTGLFPAADGSIQALVRLDLLLLAAAFGSVAWAFGLQAFCLAVIAWSVNPLSRYEWVGDAFLRQIWFSTALIGLCLLARQRHALASILLATSAGVRLFPLLYSVAYALGRLREWRRTGVRDPGFVRFVATGTVCGLLLVGAAVWTSGRGPQVLVEFGRNMASYSELKAANSIGLQPLLSYTSRKPVPRLVSGQLGYDESDLQALARQTFESRRVYYYAAIAIYLLLFAGALRQALDWEAAVLGFVFMLLFTQAGSYYLTYTVPIVLLGLRRPRIVIGLMSALAAWCVALLALSETAAGFAWASAIALALALFVLWEMRGPANGLGPRAQSAVDEPSDLTPPARSAGGG